MLPEEEEETAVADDYDDVEDIDDIVKFPAIEKRYIPDLDNLVVRFLHNDVVIEIDDEPLSFNARTIGFNESNVINQLKINYSSTVLNIILQNIHFKQMRLQKKIIILNYNYSHNYNSGSIYIFLKIIFK